METYTNKIIYLDGKLYRVLKTFEGDEDLSYHGSPWYETFVEVQDLETDEIKVFGDQKYHWYIAESYIKSLEKKLEKIKEIL